MNVRGAEDLSRLNNGYNKGENVVSTCLATTRVLVIAGVVITVASSLACRPPQELPGGRRSSGMSHSRTARASRSMSRVPPQKRGTPSQSKLPDLKITNVMIQPKPPVVGGYATITRGEDYSVRCEVANVGQGAVTGAVAVEITWGCQGPGTGATRTLVVNGGLAAGAKKTSSATPLKISTNRPHGLCKLKLTADPDDIWRESDESEASNIWKVTIKVH